MTLDTKDNQLKSNGGKEGQERFDVIQTIAKSMFSDYVVFGVFFFTFIGGKNATGGKSQITLFVVWHFFNWMRVLMQCNNRNSRNYLFYNVSIIWKTLTRLLDFSHNYQ